MQSSIVPKERYRISLAALDEYCKATFAGKGFAALDAAQQDQVLHGLEDGEIKLKDGSGKDFFEAILANTMEGFFADPIYGGNRDMAGWKLVGFPGARYDYRDHVSKHNQPYPLPPVSILGRSDLVGSGLKASSAHGDKAAAEGRGDHRSRLDRRDPRATSSPTRGSTSSRSSAVPGAIPRPPSTSATRRTSCATPCGSICSSARRKAR